MNSICTFTTQRFIFVVAVLCALFAPSPSLAANDTSVGFTIDDDSAKGGGTLKAVIKLLDSDGAAQEVSVLVKVKDGDDRSTVRDEISNALKNDSKYQKYFDTPTNDKTFGYFYNKCIPKDGVKVISASLENPDQIKKQSYGGGTKVAGLSNSQSYGFFALYASAAIAVPGDMLGVKLLPATADIGTFAESDVTTFVLSNYAGLTSTQILQALAAEIDASPLYDAYIVGDEARITGAFNREFGVDLITSDSDVTLSGRSGVSVANVPEPSILSMIVLALALLSRTTKRNTSRST